MQDGTRYEVNLDMYTAKETETSHFTPTVCTRFSFTFFKVKRAIHYCKLVCSQKLKCENLKKKKRKLWDSFVEFL